MSFSFDIFAFIAVVEIPFEYFLLLHGRCLRKLKSQLYQNDMAKIRGKF